MRKVYIAELTMPNNGAWNNVDTGRVGIFTLKLNNYIKGKGSQKRLKELVGDYYYNFEDGWGANVKIRLAEPKEKPTGKFRGYNWMVEEIVKYGKIRTLTERHEAKAKEAEEC